MVSRSTAQSPSSALARYVTQRASSLGLTSAELARRTGLSRQTLHDLALVPEKLPMLATMQALADALKVHPMRLLQLVFPLPALPGEPTHAPSGDASAFVADSTVPDGEPVLAGQTFIKSWVIRNAGCIAWRDRWLVCMDEDIAIYTRRGDEVYIAAPLLPAVSRVPIATTLPGQEAHISVRLTAPSLPGTVVSYWKSAFADGTLCFPEATGLWVKVRVLSTRSTLDGMPSPAGPATAF